jgi:hypothetical protein
MQLIHGLTCSAETVVHYFHQHTLLRVHGIDLAGLDIKESSIELVDTCTIRLVQPIGVCCVGGSMMGTNWVVKRVDIESR